MGIIRGGLIALLSLLLFLSLFSAGLFLTLSYSLEYERIQPQLASISKQFITGKSVSQEINLNEILAENTNAFKEYCQNNSEYVFNYEGNRLVVPCELAEKSPEEIVDYGAEYLIKEAYYKERECDFLNCLRKGDFLALVSEKARDYWMEKFYFALIISFVLTIALFFLVRKKSTLPVILGGELILSSVSLTKVKDFIAPLIGSLFSPDIKTEIMGVVSIFFSSAKMIAIGMSLIGGVTLCLGVVLKLSRFILPKDIQTKPQESVKEPKSRETKK